MATHHPNPQSLTLTSNIPDRGNLTLTATITPQTSPKSHGLHLVFPAADSAELGLFKDFPVLSATVLTHDIAGYGAVFCWIQLVKSTAEGHGSGWKMDLAPALQGLAIPFNVIGVSPSFFDAPVDTERGEEIDWTAQAFLCVVERCLVVRRIRAVEGFEWGWERRLVGEGKERKIVVKELKGINVPAAWREKLGMLRGEFGEWEFLDNQCG